MSYVSRKALSGNPKLTGTLIPVNVRKKGTSGGNPRLPGNQASPPGAPLPLPAPASPASGGLNTGVLPPTAPNVLRPRPSAVLPPTVPPSIPTPVLPGPFEHPQPAPWAANAPVTPVLPVPQPQVQAPVFVPLVIPQAPQIVTLPRQELAPVQTSVLIDPIDLEPVNVRRTFDSKKNKLLLLAGLALAGYVGYKLVKRKRR